MQLEPMVQRLVEIQAQEGLTGAAFARKLGVHAGHWSKVRRGLEKAGKQIIDGALRNYPELMFIYADGLRKSSTTNALKPEVGAA